MGYFKEHQLEVQERGYDYIGEKWACANCLSDADLKQFVQDHTSHTTCSYCGRQDDVPIAMRVDDLLDEIADAVFTDWRSIEGSEFFEGEQMVASHGTDELFRYEIGWPFENEQLANDIIQAFVIEDWVEISPLRLGPGEALVAGWEEFSKQVRTVTRYLFFREPEGYEDWVEPARMLHEIHKLVDDYGLVVPIQRNSSLFRARSSQDPDRVFETAEDLGAPSPEKARRSSRMSPAGIPVFYGALDLNTAVRETLAHASAGNTSSRIRVSWGTFKTLSLLHVLDLTSMPQVPGFFSPDRRNREPLSFLRIFAEKIANPIPQDGREHIEYVPTQVVAEYFRHVYRGPEGLRIDGIQYPSSVHNEGISCVLFLGAESCCDFDDWDGTDEPHRLALDRASTGSSLFMIRWEADTQEN